LQNVLIKQFLLLKKKKLSDCKKVFAVKKSIITYWLNYFIATVWIANGLFCKVLNLVSRHQQIAERILNIGNARPMILFIGFAEIGMAVWILSGIWKRANAIMQILIIATMNILEFILVPDLLLWGKANIFFAFMFIFIIYYKEFYHTKKINQETVCYPS